MPAVRELHALQDEGVCALDTLPCSLRSMGLAAMHLSGPGNQSRDRGNLTLRAKHILDLLQSLVFNVNHASAPSASTRVGPAEVTVPRDSQPLASSQHKVHPTASPAGTNDQHAAVWQALLSNRNLLNLAALVSGAARKEGRRCRQTTRIQVEHSVGVEKKTRPGRGLMSAIEPACWPVPLCVGSTGGFARPKHLRRPGPLLMQPLSAHSMRILLRLQTGAHSLPIVLGRRTGTPRAHSLCQPARCWGQMPQGLSALLCKVCRTNMLHYLLMAFPQGNSPCGNWTSSVFAHVVIDCLTC